VDCAAVSRTSPDGLTNADAGCGCRREPEFPRARAATCKLPMPWPPGRSPACLPARRRHDPGQASRVEPSCEQAPRSTLRKRGNAHPTSPAIKGNSRA
jgi:hypothetical protein